MQVPAERGDALVSLSMQRERSTRSDSRRWQVRGVGNLPSVSAPSDDIEHMDEKSFEALEDNVDRLALEGEQALEANPGSDLPANAPIRSEADFEAAVRAALDALPGQVEGQLRGVAVTVSDDGSAHHAYGMFVPGAQSLSNVAQWFPWGEANDAPDQIVIYRDTLMRDFGKDQTLLRAKIIETVRHEVGHLLGLDEAGVRKLGL
jgi:predicted Zn-dependent protease with MMP-like domain